MVSSTRELYRRAYSLHRYIDHVLFSGLSRDVLDLTEYLAIPESIRLAAEAHYQDGLFDLAHLPFYERCRVYAPEPHFFSDAPDWLQMSIDEIPF